MKAALYEGKETIRIVDIPKPVPKAGEVLVKIKYAGICGSDLEGYKTGLYPVPVVMGHEACGVIEELGPDVKKWKVGNRVSINPIMPCGKCYWCLKGYTNICESEFEGFGIYKNGGFTEYATVPASSLITLPDTIPNKHGTVFDQIATGLLAVREGPFITGESAVVLGLGTIGQFLMQILKISGARKLIVIEKNKHRLEVAKKFNPDIALNKTILGKVKGATERRGADFVFECTGRPAAINATSSLVRKGGTVVQVGVSDTPFEISYLPFIMNHNKIQCVFTYHQKDFEYAVELVAKKLIDPEPIVTKIISLDDIVEEGFQEAINPDTKEIKIIVEP